MFAREKKVVPYQAMNTTARIIPSFFVQAPAARKKAVRAIYFFLLPCALHIQTRKKEKRQQCIRVLVHTGHNVSISNTNMARAAIATPGSAATAAGI